MKKGRLYALVLFIIAVLVAAGWTFNYLAEKEKEAPMEYKTQHAKQGDIVKKTIATGAIIPREEIEIKPQISGVVEEIFIEAGEKLKKRDPIARVKIIPNISGLSNAENRLNRAKIARSKAQADYDRNKELLDKGVIAPATFINIQNALDNAKEEVKAAQDNLSILKKGVSRRSGKTTNTIIKSTIDGMVLDVPVKAGNSVVEVSTFNAGTTIANIADMGDLIFLGKIDESEVEKLHEGMDIVITIGAIGDKEFNAKLEYISPKGVEDNGAIQFEIKAALKLPEDEFIRAGYSANADIVLDRKDDVLTISEALIQYDKEQKPFVEIEVGDNQWERRDVTLGLSNGMIVEVVSGITEDDAIKIWNQPIKRKGKKKHK